MPSQGVELTSQLVLLTGFGSPPAPVKEKLSPVAKDLAMGHWILRAVERGEVRDLSEAARRLGVSQARVSMLVSLTFLAPNLQEGILSGCSWSLGLNIHHLLPVARLLQ
jgi:ABC-type spermidine/putrescine transport system permease subunit II